MVLEQLVVYAVIGLALDAAGQDYTKPLYWCVLVLVLLSNYLSRREGYSDGIDDSQIVLETAMKMLDEVDAKTKDKQ